ncbi:hypothetical protein [Psychrobacter piscatorii]|nr:hypothetical protein [Psychrobacter piscatorii]
MKIIKTANVDCLSAGIYTHKDMMDKKTLVSEYLLAFEQQLSI